MNKTINVKIPMTIAQAMDDRAQLNPQYLTYFIKSYLLKPCPGEYLDELTYNYSFKIDADIHRSVKLKAIENNLSMNEMLGRLLKAYY